MNTLIFRELQRQTKTNYLWIVNKLWNVHFSIFLSLIFDSVFDILLNIVYSETCIKRTPY